MQKILVILCALSSVALSHLCIIDPPQRGILNVSDSGDPSCFRHKFPCGGQPPQTPAVQYEGNQDAAIKFQQNYNHYSVGNPGYFEISWSENPNPSNVSEFNILKLIPDWNAHMQASQWNHTLHFVVPNVEIEHGILRVRYVPNKPTEEPFINCVDISIKQSQSSRAQEPGTPIFDVKPKSNFIANSTMLYGFHEKSRALISIDPQSGHATPIIPLPYSIDSTTTFSPVPRPFLFDQIATFDGNHTIHYVASSSKEIGSVADTLVQLNLHEESADVFHLHGAPYAALDFDPHSGIFYALKLVPADNTGQFWQYVLGSLDVEPGFNIIWTPIITFAKDDTFVNFQTTTVDWINGKYYILSGNENDAIGLSAIILVGDLNKKTALNSITMDVSKYTVQTIHWDGVSGSLVGVSPGLVPPNGPYPTMASWSVVSIDVSTGKVTPMMSLGAKAVNFYGGGVFGGLDKERILRYVFYLDSALQFAVIASIDLNQLQTSYSPVLDMIKVHNLVSF